MGEVIVITSGKGGVGKTTSTANLGAALALSGKRVVLIDADIGLRNLDVIVGLENQIVYDIIDVFSGDCELNRALIKDKRYPNLFLLPASQTSGKDAIFPKQMQRLCADLKKEYDYVLIDCPAGIEQGFMNAIAGAERALIVATPDVSSVRDADRVRKLLTDNDIKKTDLILNRIHIDLMQQGEIMSLEDIAEILPINIIGAVPDDSRVIVSASQGVPAVSDKSSIAGAAYRDIAKRVMGMDVPFMDLGEKKGFFSKLRRVFG